MKLHHLFLVLFTSFSLVEAANTQPPSHPKTFLALGDSYTIGEGVDEPSRWPNQLVAELNKEKQQFEQPTILAKTGWTTDELLNALDTAALESTYDYVSLLIGVNNQYRNRTVTSFEPEFTALLSRAIAFANNNTKKVIVLSIPDWGVTPFAKDRDSEKIAEEIAAYNTAIEHICDEKGVTFFDITPISKRALNNPDYLADDQLHPSAQMYAEWVAEIRSFFNE
ncbi:MAG: SGNH/GDSL hydrolase family protein [Flavobacteriaceae bacterium]